jgi:predicted ATPase
MFFTAQQIISSINALADVHPFHGITFLVCKKGHLPIGKAVVFPLDAATDSFLREHHQIDPGSNYFFQPFKSSEKTKKWVRHDYAAKGLQSVNTRTFTQAFIHERNSRIWGWDTNYVEVLQEKLLKGRRIPAFDLAVWLYRDQEWRDDVSEKTVIEAFISDFDITEEEKTALFDLNPVSSLGFNECFQAVKPSWSDLRAHIPAPPDAKPDQDGTLAYLETRKLGPADVFVFEPATRLSLITGDNGLGKSFLLETAWWALTGTWAGQPVFPNAGQHLSPVEITFAIEGELSQAQKRRIAFDWKSLSWPQPKNRPTIPGLIVYARVDGSYAVWDPVGQWRPDQEKVEKIAFSGKDVWDGLPGRIEGLIRDWTRWESNPKRYPYETFLRVLKRLSPPDLGELCPGSSTRIPNDKRDIPTIVHPYGETPIVYESAGVRRIVTLAYLIVWAWHEHVIASEMAQTEPQRRMVVLVDEIEAHLHPHWQRAILPALMELQGMLAESLKAQYIVSTHSPLVMASAEAIFDAQTDKLFHLDMQSSGEVTLKEVDFVRFGDVSSWLTSPVFELRHARSSEAEAAIEAAKALQLKKGVTPEEVKEVTGRLMRYLAQDDRFWPRWIAFAERHGVQEI